MDTEKMGRFIAERRKDKGISDLIRATAHAREMVK